MEARAADIAPLKRTELTDDRIGMYLSPVVVLVREWLHANRSFAQRGVLHPWSDKSVVRNFSELGRVGIDDEAGEPAAGKRPDESQWSTRPDVKRRALSRFERPACLAQRHKYLILCSQRWKRAQLNLSAKATNRMDPLTRPKDRQ